MSATCVRLLWALTDLATACIAAFSLRAVTSCVAQGLLAVAPTLPFKNVCTIQPLHQIYLLNACMHGPAPHSHASKCPD